MDQILLYCGRCGEQFDPDDTECKHCHQPVTVGQYRSIYDAEYCGVCGYELDGKTCLHCNKSPSEIISALSKDYDKRNTNSENTVITIKYQLLRAKVIEYMERVQVEGSSADCTELKLLLEQI